MVPPVVRTWIRCKLKYNSVYVPSSLRRDFRLVRSRVCANGSRRAFRHLHLNSTDPKAAIEFYTTKFDAEKASFKACWTQSGRRKAGS